MTNNPVRTARENWGQSAPDWIMGLAERCRESSQNKVAQQMGRSAAVISTVLRNKYPGDMAAIEDIYRGVFEAKTIPCPAMVEMPTHECRKWRRRSRQLVNANLKNVLMFRACNRCSNNQEGV